MVYILAAACAMMAGLIAVGLMVNREQKKLDAPYGGILIVEKNKDGPHSVYFQAVADPGTFTDGQDLKLKVRVLEESQQ